MHFFNRLLTLFTISALSLLAAHPAAAQRQQSDIDSDGYSDLVLITIDRQNGNSLLWETRHTLTAAMSSLGTFGKAGNHIIMSDWLGKGTPQLGVVKLSGRQISWQITEAASGVVSKAFGSRGQLAISGADFNNNGLADAMVAYLKGNRAVWQIWYDMLSPQAAAAPVRIVFGKKGDRIFYVNPDGTGDWLGIVRKQGSKSLIALKNPVTGEERSVSGIGAFASAGRRPRPLPVRQADGKDLLVFPVTSGGNTALYIQKLDGSAATKELLAGKGVLVVGNFSDAPGEELGLYSSSSLTVYNPAVRESKTNDVPAGIPVDEINANLMDGDDDDDDSGGSGGSGGGTPGSGSLANVCATHSPAQFPQIFMKSSSSGHIGQADPRASGFTVLCGTQCPANLRKADFFYVDGSYAGSVGIYSTWSESGRPRMYGAAGGAPSHNAARIAQIARSKGSSKLYLQISSAKTGSSTVCKEFNASGRSGGINTRSGPVRP